VWHPSRCWPRCAAAILGPQWRWELAEHNWLYPVFGMTTVPYLAVSYFYHHISSLVIIYQSIYGFYANTHSEVGHPVRNHTIPYPCGFKQGLVNFIEPDNQTGSPATVEIQLKMDLVSCLSNFNSKYTCTNAVIWAAANELPNHNVHQNSKLLNCASLFLGLVANQKWDTNGATSLEMLGY